MVNLFDAHKENTVKTPATPEKPLTHSENDAQVNKDDENRESKTNDENEEKENKNDSRADDKAVKPESAKNEIVEDDSDKDDSDKDKNIKGSSKSKEDANKKPKTNAHSSRKKSAKSATLKSLKELLNERRKTNSTNDNYFIRTEVFEAIKEVYDPSEITRTELLYNVYKAYFMEGELENIYGGKEEAYKRAMTKHHEPNVEKTPIKVSMTKDMRNMVLDEETAYKKKYDKFSKSYIFEAIVMDALEKL